MDFPGGAANFSKDQLPRANRIADALQTEDYSDTQVLAVLLQTLPRFHNAYDRLSEIDGRVVALPCIYEVAQGIPYEHIDDNVDRPSPDQDYNPNDSIVNPVAAATVRYRVVKSALELKPDVLKGLHTRSQEFPIIRKPLWPHK